MSERGSNPCDGVATPAGPEPVRFEQLVRQGSRRLAAAGIDGSWHEAGLLLAEAIGRDQAWLLAHGDEPADAAQLHAFQRLLARREAGEPMAYILGRREFWSLPLKVSPAVLVPRPETELLVEQVLALLPEGREGCPLRVADLGTGSGAIALALASERPHWRITATDASPAALAVAADNVRALALDGRVDFRHGGWYEALSGQPAFHALVSNPPYVAAGDPHLADPALRHEPPSALVSGTDGLDDIRRIIAGAFDHLHAGGWLLLEHDWDQAEAVGSLLQGHGFVAVSSRHDVGGQLRISFGQRPG